MMKRNVLILILLLAVPQVSFAAGDQKASIETKGIAFVIVKPDIAHFILKVSGSGENYESSTENAKRNIEEMKTTFQKTMGQDIDIREIKRDYKPRDLFSEKDYMEAQKEYFKSMAQAIKGEDITDTKEEEKEKMVTDVFVYFSVNKFTEGDILKFKSALAEKKIAFNKSNLFNFSIFDINQSSILFGVQNPVHHLENLSKDAYENAFQKAKIISKSSGKKIVGIKKISGCGECLEGPVNIAEINKYMGADLGPLTLDPNRLVIKYEKKYEFEIE